MSTEITPGGTITLARGAATVKGIVTQYAADSIYSRRAGEARSIVPAVNIEDLGPFPLGGPGGMEVVDYQPAPEPEPEWTDGQIGDALVHGASVRGFISNDGESFVFSVPGGGYHEAGHGSFEDFVPLVVIDPAAVDVDALVEVAHHDRVLYGDTTPDQMRRAILRVLAHMGIEATS